MVAWYEIENCTECLNSFVQGFDFQVFASEFSRLFAALLCLDQTEMSTSLPLLDGIVCYLSHRIYLTTNSVMARGNIAK